MSRTAVSSRGDERRAALLHALDEHLHESSLDSINIADISRRAGVTRSAFYFYFESKAAAVAALSEEVYDQAMLAAMLLSADGPPAANIESMIRALFAAYDEHEHLFRAMLEARHTAPAVRELWDADRTSFVAPVAALIEEERAAGRAPDGVASVALATVLLELNDRMLERVALGDGLPREQLVATVVAVWLRSIYGSTGDLG